MGLPLNELHSNHIEIDSYFQAQAKEAKAQAQDEKKAVLPKLFSRFKAALPSFTPPQVKMTKQLVLVKEGNKEQLRFKTPPTLLKRIFSETTDPKKIAQFCANSGIYHEKLINELAKSGIVDPRTLSDMRKHKTTVDGLKKLIEKDDTKSIIGAFYQFESTKNLPEEIVNWAKEHMKSALASLKLTALEMRGHVLLTPGIKEKLDRDIHLLLKKVPQVLSTLSDNKKTAIVKKAMEKGWDDAATINALISSSSSSRRKAVKNALLPLGTKENNLSPENTLRLLFHALPRVRNRVQLGDIDALRNKLNSQQKQLLDNALIKYGLKQS
jgi:hypothetical protein